MNSSRRGRSVTTIAPVSSSEAIRMRLRRKSTSRTCAPSTPTFPRDVRRGPVETHALRRLVTGGLGVTPQREEHPRLGIGVQ